MESTTTEYKITKEQCQGMIDKIAGVCSNCGGPLIPFETVDNSNAPTYWAGCESCRQFCWGAKPMIFEIANKLVRARQLHPYAHTPFPYDGNDQQKEYWYKSQTGGACGIVQLIINEYNQLTTHGTK